MDKWLRNLNFVRVVALILAILLWAVVHLDEQKATPTDTTPMQRTTEITRVSIDQEGLDEKQFQLLSVNPSVVKVRFHGKAAALNLVNTTNFKVTLDLSSVVHGAQVVPLTLVKNGGFPSGVEAEILPGSVTVTVEEKQKKEMPVTIELAGKPVEGMQPGAPIVTPNRVHVAVPSSKLEQIAAVQGVVNIEGVNAAVTKQVKLVALDAEGKEIAAEIVPEIVNVEVPITSPFKTMPLQIRLTGQLPTGYSIASFQQSVSQLAVFGPQKVLDQLEFYDGPSVDLSNITGNQKLTLDIALQDQINLLNPNKVDVYLNVVPSATKTFDQVKIIFSGQNMQYTTKVVEPESAVIAVTLEGAPDILKKMKAEDVQAIVDVSNLAFGKYELPVMFNLPPYVRKAPNQDGKVWVEIAESPNSQATTGGPDEGTGEVPAAN